MTQCCPCFLYSRTILDVNIESFEEKPWRYPEVDVTDYFNFGLKEDSWKQYCISLVNEIAYLCKQIYGLKIVSQSSLLVSHLDVLAG